MISRFPPSESRAALTAPSAQDERVIRPQLGAKHTSLAPDTLSVSLSQLACYSFQLCMMLLAFLSEKKYSPHLLPFAHFLPLQTMGAWLTKQVPYLTLVFCFLACGGRSQLLHLWVLGLAWLCRLCGAICPQIRALASMMTPYMQCTPITAVDYSRGQLSLSLDVLWGTVEPSVVSAVSRGCAVKSVIVHACERVLLNISNVEPGNTKKTLRYSTHVLCKHNLLHTRRK